MPASAGHSIEMTINHQTYYYLAAAAVVLLLVGGGIAWWLGARPSDEVQPQPYSDTIVTEAEDSVQVDSLHTLTYEHVRADIMHHAGREGYRWQETMAQYHYRETAVPVLTRMVEDSWKVRDSLELVYEQVPQIDALLRQYDQLTRTTQSRLQAQIAMLPSIEDAYRAKQISRQEYLRLLKQADQSPN